jgi:hypothetical protein
MIYMASTKIAVEKTAGEISSLLVAFGARRIVTECDSGEIIGISFSLMINDKEVPFSLPARWRPLLKAMYQDRKTPNSLCNEAQARRVAWRQVLRWIQAQLALIEVGMAEVQEVFLPYVVLNIGTGETLYERIASGEFKQLGWDKS